MRIIIVDDSVIAREGLQRLLEAEGHEVVGLASQPNKVEQAILLDAPDGVILDIRMPPTYTDEGIQLALQLRSSNPELAILVLSQYAVPEYATRLLEGGASGIGYLLKDRILEPRQLAEALRRLSDGGTVIDTDMVGELIGARRTNDALGRLTIRERDVLRLMAEGLSDKGIAEKMFVSLNTVGTHVRHIFQKLQLSGSNINNRRVLAVLVFLQNR